MASMSKALSEPEGSVRIQTTGTNSRSTVTIPKLEASGCATCPRQTALMRAHANGTRPLRDGFRGGEPASSLSANASASSDVGLGWPTCSRQCAISLVGRFGDVSEQTAKGSSRTSSLPRDHPQRDCGLEVSCLSPDEFRAASVIGAKVAGARSARLSTPGTRCSFLIVYSRNARTRGG